METLQIQPNDALSISELGALQDQGFSVIRSAHVGNLSPYNLALADAGIPMLLVDHNITGVDKNYFPEFLLSQQSSQRVAEDGTVVSRTPVGEGQFLDDLHIAGITKALPHARVFTNSEYLRNNEQVAGEIIKLALRQVPTDFERLVQPDGTTFKTTAAADLARQLGTLQLSDNPRAEVTAVLIPNAVDIMINFVVEALESERDTQYHVSGPDMILYAREPKQLEKLQKLYEIVKAGTSFGSRLPKQLTVQLVPAASARFATSLQFESALLDLMLNLDESTIALAAIAAERKAFFTSQAGKKSDTRRGFEIDIKQRQYAIERGIAEQSIAVPGLFTARRQPGFITQYDVQRDGGLFAAPQNLAQSFSELAALGKRLEALRKRMLP